MKLWQNMTSLYIQKQDPKYFDIVDQIMFISAEILMVVNILQKVGMFIHLSVRRDR